MCSYGPSGDAETGGSIPCVGRIEMKSESRRIPKFVVERPQGIRLLAIDTATAIDLEKLLSKKPLPPVQAARAEGLYSRLKVLVARRKLICIENGLDEEYSASTDAAAVARCLSPLTLGIRTHLHVDVRYREVREGLAAFLVDADEVRLPLSVYFPEAPLDRIQRIERDRIFVGASPLPPPLALIFHRQKPRDQAALESLRQSIVTRKVTYEAQLVLEKLALPRRIMEGSAPPDEIAAYCRIWEEGQTGLETAKRFADFFLSPYFLQLPMNRVEAELGADLMTSTQEIESGDFNDMSMLSVTIPLADFVLTDGRMRDRVRRRRISEAWGTKVYSPKTFNELFRELDLLTTEPSERREGEGSAG